MTSTPLNHYHEVVKVELKISIFRGFVAPSIMMWESCAI